VKKLLQRWFAPRAKLDAQQATRLAAWEKLHAPETKLPFEQARYVVVDVETTGLNLMTDTLISIGAVAVVNGRVVMGDSFSVVLQQQQSSRKENILIHGISGSVQREGVPPADALLDFLQFLGDSPLVAFHVAFDETMIRRAMRQYLNFNFKHPWLDLAYVMPALNRDLMRSHRVLDDWISRFGIRIEARHNALADALATAQLLQIAQSQALRKDISDYAGLRDLERAQRWASNVR
jgi:DNA polymerase-3 subunit epsilon